MAVDTQNKRRSVLKNLPAPDGNISISDRAMVTRNYYIVSTGVHPYWTEPPSSVTFNWLNQNRSVTFPWVATSSTLNGFWVAEQKEPIS